MREPPPDLERTLLARRGKREGDEIRFRCLFPERHNNGDAKPSARYHPGKQVWLCDACGSKGNAAHLAKLLGIDAGHAEIMATYRYHDQTGAVVYEVVRKVPKAFVQRRPDGRGGWLWNLKGVDRIPYRLPELHAGVRDRGTIHIVEGEKDADNLARLGLVATTAPGGAGKWRQEYSPHLKGARVVILPDNDEVGRRHAQTVAASLHGIAAEVRIVELPDLPQGGDVSDWIDAQGENGGLAEDLQRLADEAPAWTPPQGGGERDQTDRARDIDAIFATLGQVDDPPDLGAIERELRNLRLALAGMDPLRKALVRERAIGALKGKLQSPAKVIDAAIGSAGSAPESDDSRGTPLSLQPVEPWPEAVDGEALLDEIRDQIHKYVVLPEGAATAMALWVLHTYGFDTGWITPRLAITSPVKRCAKTLALTVLEHLVAKPLLVANVTAAALFRTVEHFKPTLLIDEADTFLAGNDELRGVLNSGHRHGGSVLRVTGDNHEPRQFSTFAPVAIAKIGKLPDTLADRSIEIEMRRKAKGEVVESFRLDRLKHLEPIRRRCARWMKDHAGQLRNAEPEVPANLHDRAADNWRSLLAIADAAGDAWSARARDAVQALGGTSADADHSIREDLLSDIQTIFEEGQFDAIFTDQLHEALNRMEHRPWPEWRRGQPMSSVQLAKLLKDFKVRPRQVRVGSENRRGYRRADFEDAFGRYLAANPLHPLHPLQVNNGGPSRGSATRYDESDVTGRQPPESPANPGVVTAVTGQEGETGPERLEGPVEAPRQDPPRANYWCYPAGEVPID